MPTPVLVGIVVAVGAGIWLFLRNRKSQAGAQPSPAAPVPATTTYNDGNIGIPAAALFTILQNHMQGPAGAPGPAGPSGATGPTGTPGTTTTVQSGLTLPNLQGLPTPQAIQSLQAAGWSLGRITLQGQSGVRNATNIGASQAQQYRVASYVPHVQGQAGQYQANSVDLVVA